MSSEVVTQAGDPMMGRAVGNYVVDKKLGEGGMGAVYRLKHNTLPNTFKAMKVMLRTHAPDAALLRFQQEAAVAPMIGTDRVVKVDDYGTFPDGTAYIVMEFLDGGDLGGYLSSNGPLPIEATLKLVYRVADTLGVAHSKGIVHRDLKPANIMLEPGTLRPKIADWGVSRASGEVKLAHTEERAVIGTPGYMAPESALGLATDARADIFSLGVILYELLTGKLPFPQTRPDSIALFQQFLAAPAPTIASMRPDFLEAAPPSVERIVGRAIAKDVGDRFQTMVEFRDAIASALQLWAQISGGDPRSALGTMLSAKADSSGPQPTVRAKAGEVADLIARYGTPTPRPTADGFGPSPPSTSLPSLPPQPAPSRSGVMIALLVFGVGSAAVAGWVVLNKSPAEAPKAAAPVAVVAPALAPAQPNTVGRFLISSIPIGATVSVEGRAIGTTPVIVSGKPGETKRVHLSMPGHQDKDAEIEFATDDRKADFQLMPSAPAPTAKHPAKPADHSKHSGKDNKKPSGEESVNPWQ